ncbi:hypothetical protein [Kitasatospora sp. P5_F3]
MNQHAPLTSAWLTQWRTEITQVLDTILPTFEETYGYWPGANEIRDPDEQERLAARAFAEDPAFADLATFYGSIGEVSLSGIGNGYWIQSATEALRARTIPEPAVLEGVALASDGGGIQFVLGTDGAVHRSRTAGVETEFDQVAASLKEFLDLLRQSVLRFQMTAEPGYL